MRPQVLPINMVLHLSGRPQARVKRTSVFQAKETKFTVRWTLAIAALSGRCTSIQMLQRGL